MTDRGLTSEQLIGMFYELDLWLAARKADTYRIVVVGGAAIALQWNPSRLTNDVDAISEGFTDELREGIAAVAAKQGDVRADWLNDARKISALSPQTDTSPTPVYEGTNLVVYGASARYVMAMKAISGRPVDLGDLPVLVSAADFDSLDEALEWIDHAYPLQQPPVPARYALEQTWADLYG